MTKLYELTDHQEALISYLWKDISRLYWNHYQEIFDSAYGASEDPDNFFKKHKISWHNFWADEDLTSQKPNITIGKVKIYWYKYFGRSMETSAKMSTTEWIKFFDNTLKLLRKIEKKDDYMK
jgi:hypothetical protein